MKETYEGVHVQVENQLPEQWMQWHLALHHVSRSLLCVHLKRWILNRLKGFLYTQQRKLATNKHGNPI